MTAHPPTASAPGADISRWRVASPFSVVETADRLQRAVALNPAIRIFARIDQSRIATEAGADVAPMVQLLFENIRFTRQIMETNPEAVFNLPVKALIWQESTHAGAPVWLRTTAPEELEPSPGRRSAFIHDVAMILGAMIDRVIDPDDALAVALP
jgi:uncharacterized protein (DUF302 family)